MGLKYSVLCVCFLSLIMVIGCSTGARGVVDAKASNVTNISCGSVSQNPAAFTPSEQAIIADSCFDEERSAADPVTQVSLIEKWRDFSLSNVSEADVYRHVGNRFYEIAAELEQEQRGEGYGDDKGVTSGELYCRAANAFGVPAASEDLSHQDVFYAKRRFAETLRKAYHWGGGFCNYSLADVNRAHYDFHVFEELNGSFEQKGELGGYSRIGFHLEYFEWLSLFSILVDLTKSASSDEPLDCSSDDPAERFACKILERYADDRWENYNEGWADTAGLEMGSEMPDPDRPQDVLDTINEKERDLEARSSITIGNNNRAGDVSSLSSLQGMLVETLSETNVGELGRMVHHAPDTMVQDREYFIELLIHGPSLESRQEIDQHLTAQIGDGGVGADGEPKMSLEYSDIDTARKMTVRLTGSASEVETLGSETQIVNAGKTTKWFWSVRGIEPGNQSLRFAVFRVQNDDGSDVEQLERVLPIRVRVVTLDELLSVDTPSNGLIGAENLLRSAEAQTKRDTFSSDQSSPNTIVQSRAETDLVAMSAPPTRSFARSDSAGCSVTEGSNDDWHALIVTNLSYNDEIGALKMTHTDGERMASALSEVGFNTVHCRDLDRTGTVRALIDIGSTARRIDEEGREPVTFFYYSGHGVNADNQNILLPVDVNDASDAELESKGVKFDEILNRVSKTGAKVSFTVFDACRVSAGKGNLKGLIPAAWVGNEVYQAFAASPGDFALDNGLYSEALANEILSSSEPAESVFNEVQKIVAQVTRGEQRPHNDDRLTQDFFFREVP